MSREKRFSMWMTDREYERLKIYAKNQGVSMAEVLRDYIKTLTPPEGGDTTSHG
jgi:predicted DNA-binding protein